MPSSALARRKELLACIFLVAMTISNVVILPGLIPFLKRGYQNFTIFYAAGQMVRHGQIDNLYDLSAQYKAQRQVAADVRIRQAALPYNHPPFEALLFVPLTFFPYWTSYLLWTALNLILVAASLMILRKRFSNIRTLSPALLALSAVGFFPLVSSIIQGQDCILLLFLVVLALVAFEDEQDIKAGAFLAAGMFRFQLALPLVLILAVRRWRVLIGFVPVAGILGIISVVMIGWRGAANYVQLVLSLEKSGAGGSIVSTSMPNLRGIIAGLPGVNPDSQIVVIATLASSIAVVALAMWRLRTGIDSLRFSFALATIVAILVSYHALTYDLSLLLPMLLLLFSAPGHDTKADTKADILLLLIIFLIPRFGLPEPWLGSLAWFVALMIWLFRKHDSGRARGQPI